MAWFSYIYLYFWKASFTSQILAWFGDRFPCIDATWNGNPTTWQNSPCIDILFHLTFCRSFNTTISEHLFSLHKNLKTSCSFTTNKDHISSRYGICNFMMVIMEINIDSDHSWFLFIIVYNLQEAISMIYMLLIYFYVCIYITY